MSDQSGFYYLHTEGALIFKSSLSHSERDLIESPFVEVYWRFDAGNRAHAWQIAICAAAAGVHPERIRVLRDLWSITEEDADQFAEYLGLRFLTKEGGNPQLWKIGTGGAEPTKFAALVNFAKAVGWKPNKDSLTFLELAGGG